MKLKCVCIMFCCVAGILLSCSRSSASVRVSFEHAYGTPLEVAVLVEGEQGLSLNAARVLLRAPDSTARLLEYRSDSCAYAASIPSPPSGTYVISVSSLGLHGDVEKEIPFTALASKPVISDVSDAGGNSAGAGDPLLGSEAILVTCGSVPGSDRYHLYVYSSSTLAYSASSASPANAIPVGSLGAGTYTACVEAQSVSGDPLFLDDDYCSVSSSASSYFVFNVE